METDEERGGGTDTRQAEEEEVRGGGESIEKHTEEIKDKMEKYLILSVCKYADYLQLLISY